MICERAECLPWHIERYCQPPEGLKGCKQRGWNPSTAKLICLNETVETSNDAVHHSHLVCLVNELTHGLNVPEPVRTLVANVLYCWALKYHVPLVAHPRGVALLAVPPVPGRVVPPAHHHWQCAAAKSKP